VQMFDAQKMSCAKCHKRPLITVCTAYSRPGRRINGQSGIGDVLGVRQDPKEP
jgi:hypothetical protein